MESDLLVDVASTNIHQSRSFRDRAEGRASPAPLPGVAMPPGRLRFFLLRLLGFLLAIHSLCHELDSPLRELYGNTVWLRRVFLLAGGMPLLFRRDSERLHLSLSIPAVVAH